MRTRLPLIGRFAVYAAIIAFGVHHVVTRDDAQGAGREPSGRSVSGKTTEGLPAAVRVDGDDVVAVHVTWRATCDDGTRMTSEGGFADAFEGDIQRDGQRFRDEWEDEQPGADGRSSVLRGRLNGEASGAVARGTAEFELDFKRDGEVVRSCESEAVGFALDL